VRWVTSSRASKRRRNSLTVNGIRPVGVGAVLRSIAVATARKGMGEHGQGGPAVPGAPAPHLVLIQSDQSFGGLERFFDAPALTGDGDQGAQRNGSGAVAAQVGMLAGGVVAADQHMMAAGVGVVFGQQPIPRPGVQPWPVRAGAGGVFLPGVCRDQRGQRIDADRAGMGGHAPVGRNRHHITQSVASNGCAQSWVSSIDFVAGHPPRGYSGGHSAVDQCCRQRWFGRETPLVGGDSGVGAAIMVVGPAARKVQSPVDQRVPTRGRIRQIHRHLGVLDAARGTAVLALHPDAVHTLLDVTGLIDHQDRTRVAERIDDVIAQIVADIVGVPAGPCQQVLQPVRSDRAAMLGDRPAILAIQARDHPGHQLARMAQRLVPGKTRRDPIQHRRELRLPPIRVYAMSRGDGGIFRCLHKLRTMPRSPRLPAPTRQHQQSLSTAAVLTQPVFDSCYRRRWSTRPRGHFNEIDGQQVNGRKLGASQQNRL
jgi:hypothetical protein